MKEKLHVIGPGNDFLHMIPGAQTTKAKMNKRNKACLKMETKLENKPNKIYN